jgi:hypothetical protein
MSENVLLTVYCVVFGGVNSLRSQIAGLDRGEFTQNASTTPRTLEYQPETAISHVVNFSYQELEASCRNYGTLVRTFTSRHSLNSVRNYARMRCVSHICACGDPWSLTAVLSLISLRWRFILIDR